MLQREFSDKMAAWSKMLCDVSCMYLVHPWTNSCLLATMDTFAASCVGSFGFFTLLYFCQYVSMVLKKKKKASFKDFLRTHLRSTCFGACVASVTLLSSCFIRNVLGKYYYYTVILVPAFLGGCTIFLEKRKGREFFTNAFANCALELGIRQLENLKLLSWTPNSQTIFFMFLSSVLSPLLGFTSFDRQYFWFFQPPKINHNTGLCFHNEDCRKHIFNLLIMYSTTGLGLQFLRLCVANLKTPKLIIYSLTQPKTFKLAAFLGSYVVIYQTLRCFLYQMEKKYSLVHDGIAGFLAGTAFRFQPNIPILNSAIINIIQVLTEMGCKRKVLPNFPYLEAVFAVSCGLLFHSRFMFSEQCPQLMIYIMSAITHGKSDTISQHYLSILNKLTLSQN